MPREKGIIRNVQYCSAALDARGEPCLTVWLHGEAISTEFTGEAIQTILERHGIADVKDYELLKGRKFKTHDSVQERVKIAERVSGVSNIRNFPEFGGES